MTSPYYDAHSAKEATSGGPGNRGIPANPDLPYRPKVHLIPRKCGESEIWMMISPYITIAVGDDALIALRDQIDVVLRAKRG